RVRAGRRVDRLPRRRAHRRGRVLAAGRLRRDPGEVGQQQPVHVGALHRPAAEPDARSPARDRELHRGVDLRRAAGRRLARQPGSQRHALPAARGSVMRTAVVLGAAIVAAAAGAMPVRAQPVDVAAQIKLVEIQPAEMDRSTWKERRRDAARKLGQSKDKRAVAVLIKLAETETFDIIGEIAIEGLGNLGDAAAAPTLQRILADPARDKSQRDLAKKALGKLGTAAESGTGAGATGAGGRTGAAGAGATGAGAGTTGAGAAGAGATGAGATATAPADR